MESHHCCHFVERIITKQSPQWIYKEKKKSMELESGAFINSQAPGSNFK